LAVDSPLVEAHGGGDVEVFMGWLRVCSGVVAAASTVALLSSAQPTSGEGSSVVAQSESCTVARVVRTWSLRRVVEQTVVVPVDEQHVSDVSAEVSAGVGGVILFGSSAPSDLGTDLVRLLDRAPGGIVPVVMTDEEGGAVQRMANLVGWMPSARRMARTMSTAQAHALARRVGQRMHDTHVTMNLAPVLDLDDRPGPSATNPDGTRSFSIEPAVTRAYGLAFARGLLAAGVAPVVKHFPGLGRATTNPDFAPAWTQPWSVLEQKGLRPFQAAVRAGLPVVMVTTARVPGLTRLPATLSWRAIHGALRHQLGFHGLVLTDSLSAGAVSHAGFSVPRAAVKALEVGADMILFNAAADVVRGLADRVVGAIVQAVRDGDLPLRRLRTAAIHVLKAKHAPVCG
jgi:beta-N-acetylhexosaminidase